MPQASINLVAVSGDQTILAVDAAGSNTDLVDICFLISGAGTVTLKDGGGTTYGVYTAPAAGIRVNRPAIPMSVRFSFKGNLILNLSTSLTVTGDFTYTPRT